MCLRPRFATTKRAAPEITPATPTASNTTVHHRKTSSPLSAAGGPDSIVGIGGGVGGSVVAGAGVSVAWVDGGGVAIGVGLGVAVDSVVAAGGGGDVGVRVTAGTETAGISGVGIGLALTVWNGVGIGAGSGIDAEIGGIMGSGVGVNGIVGVAVVVGGTKGVGIGVGVGVEAGGFRTPNCQSLPPVVSTVITTLLSAAARRSDTQGSGSAWASPAQASTTTPSLKTATSSGDASVNISKRISMGASAEAMGVVIWKVGSRRLKPVTPSVSPFLRTIIVTQPGLGVRSCTSTGFVALMGSVRTISPDFASVAIALSTDGSRVGEGRTGAVDELIVSFLGP